MNPNIAKRRHEKVAHGRQSGASEHGHNGHHGDHSKVNVGEFERHASMIGGTVLAVCGLLRGSLSGLALAAIGGALIWRGHTGHCEVYHMLDHSSAAQGEGQQQGPGREEHQLSYESHAGGEA